MHIETTLVQLRSLRLIKMAESFEERLNRGDHNNIPCEDFLHCWLKMKTFPVNLKNRGG